MMKAPLASFFKTVPLTLALCWMPVSTIAASIPYDGAPYTAWANDYTGDEAHTVGLWKFDNPSPSADSSTNPNYDHYDASINAKGTEIGVPGRFGEAFFSRGVGETPGFSNGNDSYFSLNSGIFSTSAISVEFWYSPISSTPAAGGGYSYLFDKLFTSNAGMNLLLTGKNELLWTVGNGTRTASLRSTHSIDFVTGEWYHFALTYENVDGNGVMKMFLNGNLFGESLVSDFGDLDPGTRVWKIANRSAATHKSVPGYYDNFRISDVAFNYAPVPEPQSVAYMAVAASLLYGLRRKAFSKGGRA